MPANQLWISSIDFPPPFEPPRHWPVPCTGAQRRILPTGHPIAATHRAHVPCRRSPEIRGAGSKRLLPAGGSAREGYADLLALAVLRSARLHFTQPAQQPPKPLKNSTGSKAAIASGISLARTTLETGNFVHDAKKGLWIEIALASECSLLTLCMDRRCVAREKPRNSGVRSCTNVSGLSVERSGAPGHYGYLISK